MILLQEYFTRKDFAPPTKVVGLIYSVDGGMREGRRGKPVESHLSYPGFQAPAEQLDNAGVIALTPYTQLQAGAYEVGCQFTYKGTDYKLQWRFEVALKSK